MEDEIAHERAAYPRSRNVTNPEHAEHHIVTPVQYCDGLRHAAGGHAITVVAAYVDLGVFNPVIALGIACTKAVIVILFFMHVKYQSNLIKMTVGAGFFTFHRADHDDAVRLHEPRVGTLVEVVDGAAGWAACTLVCGDFLPPICA